MTKVDFMSEMGKQSGRKEHRSFGLINQCSYLYKYLLQTFFKNIHICTYSGYPACNNFIQPTLQYIQLPDSKLIHLHMQRKGILKLCKQCKEYAKRTMNIKNCIRKYIATYYVGTYINAMGFLKKANEWNPLTQYFMNSLKNI